MTDDNEELKKAAALGLEQVKEAARKGEISKYITGSKETMKDIQDEGNVGLATKPARWRLIVELLEIKYPKLAKKVWTHLGDPIPLFDDTFANVVVQELSLDSRFTREEKVKIRDAYCAIVPGVTTVKMDEDEPMT
jgi:hypothetical protein